MSLVEVLSLGCARHGRHTWRRARGWGMSPPVHGLTVQGVVVDVQKRARPSKMECRSRLIFTPRPGLGIRFCRLASHLEVLQSRLSFQSILETQVDLIFFLPLGCHQ